MDNDGIEDVPLWIKLELKIEADRLIFDFSKSSPPCRGPMNSVFATTASAVYISFKHLFPEIPMNAGCFEPIEVIAPETTFLNSKYPRPVSGCAAEVSQRIVDVCFGALAKALPERSTGAPVGTSLNLVIGGYDPDEDRRYILYFYTGGGHGGYAGGDGISNACTSVGLAKTPPIEIVEQHAPVLFEEYALRQDSAGAGKHRGGLGVQYSVRLLRGEAYIAVLGDRSRQGPFGILGGEHGAPTTVDFTLGGKAYKPRMRTKDGNIPFAAGDQIAIATPGGGGRGTPAERTTQLVASDLNAAYISQSFAESHYSKQVKELDAAPKV